MQKHIINLDGFLGNPYALKNILTNLPDDKIQKIMEYENC